VLLDREPRLGRSSARPEERRYPRQREPQSVSRAPETLTRERHAKLQGRGGEPWGRRVFLALLIALLAAALLNVFGQGPTTSAAAGSAATLSVESPADLRGGLIFQARMTVHALEPIARPTLILDPGWFESMSLNAIVPNPVQQSTRDGKVVLTFGKLAAGERLVVWLYFQANPVNIGEQRENVELDNGAVALAHVSRSVMVFP
jgi:hypothetical protein